LHYELSGEKTSDKERVAQVLEDEIASFTATVKFSNHHHAKPFLNLPVQGIFCAIVCILLRHFSPLFAFLTLVFPN